VPADRVHDTRLRLATLGLPKGSVAGFEMMEANRFGMTQFQERLTFQRGLEGELTRSIQALSSVQSARVHLALPNQNGFFREQQKPSASVLVALHPGRAGPRPAGRHRASGGLQCAGAGADGGQRAGRYRQAAVHAGRRSGWRARGVDAQQLQYVQQIEQLYTQRILDILEPVVGRKNVKAQVTAEVDFSQTESTSESHRPNQTPDSSAVRSQQVVESTNGGGAGALPTGIPGADDQPAARGAAAPVNGAGAGAGAAGRRAVRRVPPAGRPSASRSSITRLTRRCGWCGAGSGLVKRISAAVVLNHQTVTDDKGKTTTSPLSRSRSRS
jgi:flagellar M-ring protein FliF